MPVTAIPFKSPPPFELPDHVTEAIGALPKDDAARQVLDLLRQIGAGDAIWVDWLIDGALAGGPALATAAGREAGVESVAAELAQRRMKVDAESAKRDVFAQAIAGGKPLLVMGDVQAGAQDLLPAALRDDLLGGAPSANIGFFYVFPLVDGAGKAHGALALHRPLGEGPLNHDQPAITHALVGLLANKAA